MVRSLRLYNQIATYTHLNLGLPEEKHFNVKYELSALVLAKTSLPATTAVTIMDGGFVSVYPTYGGLHTLSSVIYTPFRKYVDHTEFVAAFPNRAALAEEDNSMQLICNDVRQYLNVTFAWKMYGLPARQNSPQTKAIHG